MTAYVPQRDSRFDHASDAIAHIEETSCVYGCKHGAQTGEELLEYGPGGTCWILGSVAVGDGIPVDELHDDGVTVTCLVRVPDGE